MRGTLSDFESVQSRGQVMRPFILLSALALATQVHAEPSADPMRRVSYSDLDLTTTAGAKRLQFRVEAAITDMCGDVGAAHLSLNPNIQHCRDVANDSARQQLAVLVGRAHLAALTARR